MMEAYPSLRHLLTVSHSELIRRTNMCTTVRRSTQLYVLIRPSSSVASQLGMGFLCKQSLLLRATLLVCLFFLFLSCLQRGRSKVGNQEQNLRSVNPHEIIRSPSLWITVYSAIHARYVILTYISSDGVHTYSQRDPILSHHGLNECMVCDLCFLS
jgi:hypothetical protein